MHSVEHEETTYVLLQAGHGTAATHSTANMNFDLKFL